MNSNVNTATHLNQSVTNNGHQQGVAIFFHSHTRIFSLMESCEIKNGHIFLTTMCPSKLPVVKLVVCSDIRRLAGECQQMLLVNVFL